MGMRPIILLPLTLLVFGNVTYSPAKTSSRSDQNIYAQIPESHREEFRAALERVLALEKTGKWGEVYDRFYLNDRRVPRSKFTMDRRNLKVVAFRVKQINWVPPIEAWVISGCAFLSPPPSVPGLEEGRQGVISDFQAKRTAKGWRFDAPPAIIMFCEPPFEHTCVPGEP
ncbi:MAG TPA: hypothetical protein VMH00_14150 [Candidatus Limnocylindrales bacterium]|nr:hypothetical protein [Candidatus Limnocylindrales bacterium]